MTDKLTLIVQESGLEKSKTEILLKRFGIFFEDAKKIAQDAKKIVVADEHDLETMQEAREARLEIRDIRTKGVEPLRIELKAQAVRENKAIDGISNVIKALIVPVEEYLMEQEKFAERIKAEKERKIEARRESELLKYADYIHISLHPKDLSTESFEKMIETYRFAHEAKKKAEEDVEKERVAKVKSELAEQERIKKENEKLKVEAEKRERAEAKRQEKADAKLKVERQAREKVEARLKAKEELIRRRKEALAAKEKAEKEAREAAQRKALLAPDKEKLLNLAQTIALIQYPALGSKQAQDICEATMNKLIKIAEDLEQEAKKL